MPSSSSASARRAVAVREVSGTRSGAVGRGSRGELATRWPNVATITHADTWTHKGVEYDAVVVDSAGMDAAELYLAASAPPHELVIVR